MAGLVEEIQALSLDPTVSISDLLRRVKLAAVKLSLQDTVDWVDRELKGYEDKDEVPDYRQVVGELKAHSPYHGVLPVHWTNEVFKDICNRPIFQSISSIENLKGDGQGSVMVKVGFIAEMMNKANGTPGTDYYVHVPQNALINIVDQVRSLILEWSCNLEQQGILGEGISFSMEEKKKAEQAAQSITIHNYGHFHQGDTNGNQNKSVIGSVDNSVNTITTENVFDQLIQAVDSSIGNENDREAILDLVKAMQATQGTADYKPLFQKWVGYLAEYATVLGPFLPTLSQFAG